MDSTLEEWLDSTQQLREGLLAWDKKPLPSDATERHQHLDEAVQAAADAGRLFADAETFFLHAKAEAVFKIRREHDDLSAPERKILVEAEVADLGRLVEGLAVCKQTLRSRIYATMNENRASR